jgi:hypothetical protein
MQVTSKTAKLERHLRAAFASLHVAYNGLIETFMNDIRLRIFGTIYGLNNSIYSTIILLDYGIATG